MSKQSIQFRTKQARLAHKLLTTLIETTEKADTEVKTMALVLATKRRELCTMIGTDTELRHTVDKLVETAKRET